MAENFDLLGDPIPDGWGKRGRPPHLVTVKNRNKVMMLLALGWSNPRIASALGITPPTFRKNYFREIKVRDQARERLDGARLDLAWTLAKDGNMTAFKEFTRMIERNDLMLAESTFISAAVAPPPRAARLGKKEEASIAAASAGENTEWGDDLQRAGRAN